MTPRAAILRRIRRTLAGSALLPQAPLPHQPGAKDRQELIAKFAYELDALQGTMLRTRRSEAVDLVADLLAKRQAKQLLTWDANRLPEPGLLDGLQRRGYICVAAELSCQPKARHTHLKSLAEIEVGITGAGGAIADIGALVMPGGEGQGRLASLLPPVHVALVTPDQFYPTLEAWVATQQDLTMFDNSSSLTLIAGPSRTSDIERVTTLGAHGPREMFVICLD